VIEPLRISFEVACPVEHAFRVWTTRISQWWPADHTVSGDPAEIVLEGGVGGRIFERTATGTIHEWGEITTWEPPERFGYLWYLRQDRADATDVEIVFIDLARTATRVEIEHRGWERLGAKGSELRRRNNAGWRGVTPHLIAACEATGTTNT
jgi:Activator of Hsp90 ATPase homolog 1-like protein